MYKLKLNKRLYRQLLAADVAVVRPAEDVDSQIIMHPAVYYRRYVAENQEAIGYVAYQGWQKEGRGIVTLMPLWEKDDPELAVLYVSEANLLKLPLLEPCSLKFSCFPRWYVSLKELVRSQIVTRLNFYDPQTEVVILGQVEDMSYVFPDEEIYQQIQRVEIFTFSDFEPSIQGCYERFRGRASEFVLD